MISKFKQVMSVKTANRMAFIAYSLFLLVHVLVVVKVVPFDWVNGGMSESYDAQLTLSIANFSILLCMGAYIVELAKTKQFGKVESIMLRFFTGFFVLSLILQLIGTDFERYVVSVIVLLAVVSHLRLSLQTPSKKKTK